MSIKVSKLLSISIQLASEACKIVKQSYMNVEKYTKEGDDPVTQADFKIQTMVIKGLKQYYPQIKIIGQEQTQYKGQININYSDINEQFLPKEFNFQRECALDDICIWIDPIDCTRGFVEGYVQDVTVLIGISQNKKAQMGIVGIPFKKINNEAIYQPSVVFGSATQKKAYQYFHNGEGGYFQELNTQKQQKMQEIPKIAISNTRKPGQQQQVIDLLKGKTILAGGSGRKIMMVAKRQVQMMIYMKSFTFKWDSCAGQAIIRAMRGYFYSPFGQEISYDPTKTNEANKNGFFCTFDRELYENTLQVCKKLQEKKKDLVV